MLLHHIIILALIQGITEFLPISSSGHLVLGHAVLHGDINDISWKSSDVVLDVAVHIGTLLSVMIYFREDLKSILSGGLSAINGKGSSQESFLALYILVASLPVVIAGLVLNALSPDWVRSIHVVAWTTLIFGIVLWIADRYSPKEKNLQDMTLKSSLIVGLAQVLALVPGTSRSGITMTAARFCGFNRQDSAKFSLLLAIVAIAGAGALSGIDLFQNKDAALGYDALLAMIVAFISGWIAIALMMRWLQEYSFLPFVIYRIALGMFLLVALYTPLY